MGQYTEVAKTAYNTYTQTLKGTVEVAYDALPEDERNAWETMAESFCRWAKKTPINMNKGTEES